MRVIHGMDKLCGVNLANLDLNLLVALRALLEERSVTAAGRRIGLSQPAMSAALARLRRHFGDELLSRSGNSYELTALGSALLDRTAVAYDLLERVFTSQADFDPAADRREFTVLASDYAVAVIGVELARVIDEQAPAVRLTFRKLPSVTEDIGATLSTVDGLLMPHGIISGLPTVELARVIDEQAPAVRLTFRKLPSVTEDIGATLSTVDGLLMPHGIISGLPTVELYRDRWTVVAAADNPEIGDEISLDQLGVLPWAAFQQTYDAPVAKQLSMLGVEPRVQVSVDSFTLLPALVAGTRRIAMVQGLLAERLSEHAGVRVLECPFDAVPVQEAMWWHPVHTHDAGHVWLRETIARVGAGIGSQR